MQTPTTLEDRVAAMRNRMKQRQQDRRTAASKEAARIMARHDAKLAEKFEHARSVIRNGDFSDTGYLVRTGLVDL